VLPIVYREHLKVCKLPTLFYRWVRGDMIEMYKFLACKYDANVTPRVIRVYGSTTRGNVLNYTKVEQSMICASIISLTGWLMLGTVTLTMLYYLKLVTLLNHNLINFGNTKI